VLYTYGRPRRLRLRKSKRNADARAEDGEESRHHDEEQQEHACEVALGS